MGQAMYPWNVDRVNTNTQNILGELGRGRSVRDSEIQGVYKRSQGNITLNPLHVKPEANSCTPITILLSVRICNGSTSKLTSSVLFESSTLQVH